jgi:hypothetical protein
VTAGIRKAPSPLQRLRLRADGAGSNRRLAASEPAANSREVTLSFSVLARCGIAVLVRRTLLILGTCTAGAVAAGPSARGPWISRSSRSGENARRHSALMELRLLQSLTTRWRPRLCCSFAVPLMRFGPLQHMRNTGFTFDNPGLPHPVRSASRVSHPPDGFPPRAPPRPCCMPRALMGFAPPELFPPHEP